MADLSTGRFTHLLGFYRSLALILLVNVLLHLILDTFVGGIQWFAPWSRISIALVEVPARFQIWVLSFVLHWTFIPELLICLAALLLLRKRKQVEPWATHRPKA